MFNPRRFSLARRRRGFTAKAIAELVGVTSKSILNYENGVSTPSDAVLLKIAAVTDFPVPFFSGDDMNEPLEEATHFRALSKMSAKRRNAALAAGAIANKLNRWIEEEFELPPTNVPNLEGIEPETAAQILRREWGLGAAPIPNVVHLLELRGVRVYSLVEECREVDAFSFWDEQTPIVVLNTMKSAERGRTDGTHELGHLTLHRQFGNGNRELEDQANRFAGAFLLPEVEVRQRRPPVLSLAALMEEKSFWGVSLISYVHRLNQLGLITEWQYRELCITISAHGYRTKEPSPMVRESSQVLAKVLKLVRQGGQTLADIAKALDISESEVKQHMFGLTMIAT